MPTPTPWEACPAGGAGLRVREGDRQSLICMGVEAFVPDYRLAPEHPFPAATEDVRACYSGLIERGLSRVAPEIRPEAS